jgi:hypothetical protein
LAAVLALFFTRLLPTRPLGRGSGEPTESTEPAEAT